MLLILFAALLSLLAVVAVWANSIVRDADRYVATVGPLAGDPDVRKAVTNRVTASRGPAASPPVRSVGARVWGTAFTMPPERPEGATPASFCCRSPER